MIVTDREAKMIGRIGNSDYNDNDPRSATWTNVVTDNRSDNGVIGSLSKKGLIVIYGHGQDSTVQLTDKGLVRFRDEYPDHWYSKEYLQEQIDQEIAESRLPNC